jgi:hypothetical protein
MFRATLGSVREGDKNNALLMNETGQNRPDKTLTGFIFW